MKEIERLTNYTFFYNNGDFDLKRIVSVAAVRKPVSEVVRQMLPDCSCRFENRRIILVKDAAPQRQTVKGVVKDEKGAPVIGATVLVTDAGQTRGISTDMNGSFTLTLPALTAEAMLEVSFIGFDTYKSAVGSRTFFDVVLTYAQQSIDEVVVVGYGVQKKANLTGAVATVSQKELKDRPVSNVGRALQGVIPNLNVTLSSGQPGAGATYNIRGTTSPNGGSPLVLIDGVETYPDRINSNDIESITVLKDASSAAIYGARGAFGVILITTKSGKYNEKAEVSYNGYFSVSSPTTSTDYETRGYYSAKIADFFMMATQNTPYTSYTEADYKALWERRNDKTENPARPWVVTDRRNGRQQYVYLANFDWYNYLYDDSRPTWDHNINIKGGTKALSYMVSGRYYQQKGVNRHRAGHVQVLQLPREAPGRDQTLADHRQQHQVLPVELQVLRLRGRVQQLPQTHAARPGVVRAGESRRDRRVAHLDDPVVDPLPDGRLQRHDAEGQELRQQEDPGDHHDVRSHVQTAPGFQRQGRFQLHAGLSAQRLPQRQRPVFAVSGRGDDRTRRQLPQQVQGGRLGPELLCGRRLRNLQPDLQPRSTT